MNRSRERPQVVEVEVELAQDKTALRSRKGDTGSVVWRASVDLAQSILQQYYSRKPDALLNPVLLASSHVLELGAGTGLLGAVLSPLVGRYTVTDLEALMPLIQKNMTLNAELSLPKLLPGSPPTRHSTPSSRQSAIRPNVALEALDWVDLHNASPSSRRSAYTFSPADLLLVVDCIYHPSLLPPLLSTIDHLTVPGKTAVLVVVELRAEDVVRRFFEGWLGLAAGGAWEIWSLGGALQGPYAVWVGWKVVQSASTDAL
ncbi:hypothetical protein AcW1_003697 [Taiwanofungus camphoratus]|nr:hypothetical protein AcV5_003624 [Antrodia cinnamomea]KAI0940524.1 hypothetical protein AcW1_003697 [Antrodia cinnamomea]KAI0958304.1 hypothetical protein AcV7_004160 [Antrodia cinnamomea]